MSGAVTSQLIGRRMLVTGTDHPARGKTGEVVRVEKFQGVGMGAVVRFDDGLESALWMAGRTTACA